ncbi:MAG: aminotransferase class I/II-fold pyridoxal phosphate-dependent enzyme [Thermoleophilia bacterium]|nr:aminotransferase class I/II-fold pyridoxal phosphate-dependent enzyme [Thermoleophilia bacterium]
MIDLRSDTATRPTSGMRAAIAAAAVGDEQKREDPTVNELEERAARLLGQEEAVFLPTATMANQIAIRLHTQLGDELLGEENCHVFISELGGPAVHSGVVTRGLPGVAGRYSADQVRAAYRVPAIHSPRTRLLWVENTHNASGGRVWPLEEIDELRAVALELELAFHLDGARLLNASAALGVDAAEIGGRFDTVTLCLSKGLGCPLGAILAGRSEVMRDARRLKHLFGGALRQAGIVAAAGVYALDHHVERLADDHRRAKRLALGLAEAGLAVDPDRVETNFVQVDVAPLSSEEAMALLAEEGVGLSGTIHPGVLRAVTHLDITDEDVDGALDAIPRALGARVRA